MIPLMSDGYIWGDAAVTYPDWVGTAQMDPTMTTPSILDVIDLDNDKWMIVGIDIGGGETAHELRVLAIAKELVPAGGDVLPKIAEANHGELPVTEFLIHDVDPYDVLRRISHMFDLRLRVRRTEGMTIRIVEQADVPRQS